MLGQPWTAGWQRDRTPHHPEEVTNPPGSLVGVGDPLQARSHLPPKFQNGSETLHPSLTATFLVVGRDFL